MLNSEQLNEETNPFAGTPEGLVGIEDSATRDYLNALLAGITAGHFLTPYIALERVSKVLANYQIFPPRTSFLEGDSGSAIWPVNQFGGKFGMNNDGEVGYAPTSDYSIYFEYRMSDAGMFVIYCEVVNQEELDEILADVEDEMNYDDEDDINEATLAGPETGTHKIPGASKNVKSPAEYGYGHEEEEDKMELDEAKELYHSSYTDAIQTAVNTAKKRGYEVDSDDYQNKVSSGPRKPSEGKTVSHSLKLTKDGKPTKKGLSIQVYNRGGDKSPFELNHYISEEAEPDDGDDIVSRIKDTRSKMDATDDPSEKERYKKQHERIISTVNRIPETPSSKKDLTSSYDGAYGLSEVNLDEAIGDHAALAKYADEYGRLDTDDLHRAAEHMKDHNMGALRRHLQNMDTDPRDKALEYVKKKYYAKLGYTNEAIDLANIIQDKKTGQIATKKGAPPIDLSKITQDKKTGQISAVNEVVTKRKMTSKELVARAAYLSKHKEKMAAADTGIKSSKSFKDVNTERGDYGSEPSKMKSAPKSSSKYMDIKEEDKPPFPGPYEKKGVAKDKNVAKNMARRAMKAAVEKAKSKKK